VDSGLQAWTRTVRWSLRIRGALEKHMQAYAITFAGCALCSLIFVYDVTPSGLEGRKVAVAVFTALFIGAEILALLN